MKKPKVAVIGAGWAGIAAAATLADFAHVSLFEASHQAGGRARALNQKTGNLKHLDNGQHLLIGAYEETLRLLALSGVKEDDVFCRLPLTWYLQDGLQLQAAKFPSPFHIVMGLVKAKNWTLQDKWAFVKSVAALKRFAKKNDSDKPLNLWLHDMAVPTKIIRDFWQPLVLATMNTPITVASTQVLAKVMQEGVLKKRHFSDFLIAKTNLGSAWVEPLMAYLAAKKTKIHLGHRVRCLEVCSGGRVQVTVDNEVFDAVVMAVAPYHVNDLLKTVYAPETRQALQKLNYSAITTVYLQYQETLALPKIIQGFADGVAQWLINRDALGLGKNEVAAVCSVTQDSPWVSKQEWIDAVHQDMLRINPDLCSPIAAQVITEKRATVQASSDREVIPTLRLSHHGIYLAGDYMHPVYPATLEGAVQMGQRAAACLLADWNSKCQ